MTVHSKMMANELSRSRRVSYNVFEFRANEKPITLRTQTVYLVVKAIHVLRNWVMQTSTARLRFTTKEMAEIEVCGEGKIIPIYFIKLYLYIL
jgi:hypothetical protein